ncbi:hypothetical protein [Nocardia asteroides]|uniref:hypothetical protein n=1 Tax=Nocardia asteroides TaxID=1824 RepID=UPI001E559B46|nr:hypothetical protein [Nocardia asteroides]UGT62246.1 hypothetical protein LTT61_02545 [Nocardia asteroides]
MRAFMVDGHPLLGKIPGPLVPARFGETLWVAGGGRGDSAVLRLDGAGWRSRRLDANGLRAILPLSDTTAVVAGEHGFLAIIDADDERIVPTDTGGCLYALAAVGGAIRVTGDAGFVAVLDPETGELRVEPPFTGDSVVAVAAAPGGATVFVAGDAVIVRSPDGSVRESFRGNAPLCGVAFAPDGRAVVVGDKGQVFRSAPGGSFLPCREAPSLDLEHVHYDAPRDRFLVVGADGFVGLLDDTGFRAAPPATPPYRLSGVVEWGDGHLFTGWTQQGPPFEFRGALYHDGSTVPDTVYHPPRQDFGPPRSRTVAVPSDAALGAGDYTVLPLAEATRLLPGVSWPDCALDEVRFYDGDVHVADATALLGSDTDYAVAIRGDLTVDGTLDATAGGEGYGSLLVVGGDVWARAAMFRYGIAAAIGGTLQVATVVLCDHGDDGGTLRAGEIDAQVLSYSLYFPRPDAEFDAFLIGDVYGEASFPPERADEVFVPEVLEDGFLDERTAAKWLREGRPILRED